MSRIARLAFAFVFCQPSPPEPVERRLVPLCARIPLNQVQPLDRRVELRVVGVEEQHELALTAAEFERLQATEARDAVVDVDDVVVDLQVAEVGEERGGLRLLPFGRAGGGAAHPRRALLCPWPLASSKRSVSTWTPAPRPAARTRRRVCPTVTMARVVFDVRPALARERDARLDVVVREHLAHTLGDARPRAWRRASAFASSARARRTSVARSGMRPW